MKYYKYADEYGGPLNGGTVFVETADGYTFRQIIVSGDQTLASNVSNSQWGLRLPEGYADYDRIEEVSPISKQDFDEVWNAHLERRAPIWEHAKSLHPLGMRVEGFIEIFYPQGVIVNLGDGVLAVADWEECRASTKSENMYSLHKITGTVIGYDETNQWLILGSPQVFDERLTLAEVNRFRTSST